MSTSSFDIESYNKLQYLITLSIESELLLIKGNTIGQIPSLTYKKNYSLDEIIKINKYFKICDKVSDVLLELKNIILNNKKNIKLNDTSNELVLTFPLPSCIMTEVNFHIDKVVQSEKEEMNDLYKSIQFLNEKIKKFEEDNKNCNEIIIKKLESRIVELEKENNNLKNEIIKIHDYLFPKKIFDSKISFDENMIKDWIGKKFTAKLLYRLSRNGSEPSEFHRLCDNKGPTIIFIETTKDNKFGGYTELDWDKSSSYKTDNATFLFSINHRQKYTRKNNMCSIYCREDLAPSFGGNSNPDIFCMGSCKKGQLCHSNTFATPKDLNNGEEYFDVNEMEVFQIQLL